MSVPPELGNQPCFLLNWWAEPSRAGWTSLSGSSIFVRGRAGNPNRAQFVRFVFLRARRSSTEPGGGGAGHVLPATWTPRAPGPRWAGTGAWAAWCSCPCVWPRLASHRTPFSPSSPHWKIEQVLLENNFFGSLASTCSYLLFKIRWPNLSCSIIKNPFFYSFTQLSDKGKVWVKSSLWTSCSALSSELMRTCSFAVSFDEGAFSRRAVSCLLKQVPPGRARRHTTLSPVRAASPCTLILPPSLKEKISSHLSVWLCFPLLMPGHLVLNIKHRIYFLSKVCPLFGVRCFMQEAFLMGDIGLFALWNYKRAF